MTAPLKPYESTLQNSGQLLRNTNLPSTSSVVRSAPILPPRPHMSSGLGYNSYSPYSSYGGYGSMPYRSSMYGGYGGYGGYGTYGNSYGVYGGGYSGAFGNYGPGYSGYGDDAETRFIQYAEESSRKTFSNVENIVRAFSSMAMMLDNTFFAMTSSFRAILGVAENFGRLRSMFGHVWNAVNIFRLFNWIYRKMMELTGRKLPEGSKTLAWNEAMSGVAAEASGSSGSNWPTLAFLGVILSVPYILSKFLPKYEDKLNPENWIASGLPAKAVFDFAGSSPRELSLHTNDEILLAPKSVQEEMKLTNSGWAYATCNGRAGVVPLNYIVVVKRVSQPNSNLKNPIPPPPKTHKRVSFGEDQIIEDKQGINNSMEATKVFDLENQNRASAVKELIESTLGKVESINDSNSNAIWSTDKEPVPVLEK